MKTMLSITNRFAEAIRDCTTSILPHFENKNKLTINDKGESIYESDTEKLFGLEEDEYKTTIGAIESIQESVKLLEYYFFNYSDPTNLNSSDLETHRKLILIGILNCCYKERCSIKSLHDIFKMNTKFLEDSLIGLIDDTDMMMIRHKIASPNAVLGFGAYKDFYHFSWVDENTFSYQSTNKEDYKEHNLKHELKVFTVAVNEVLFSILTKVIEAVNKSIIDPKVKFECRLVYLRTSSFFHSAFTSNN